MFGHTQALVTLCTTMSDTTSSAFSKDVTKLSRDDSSTTDDATQHTIQLSRDGSCDQIVRVSRERLLSTVFPVGKESTNPTVILPSNPCPTITLLELDSYPYPELLRQLPSDQLRRDQIPRDQLPRDQIPRDQLPRDQLPRDQIPRDRSIERRRCHAGRLTTLQKIYFQLRYSLRYRIRKIRTKTWWILW